MQHFINEKKPTYLKGLYSPGKEKLKREDQPHDSMNYYTTEL
jgi:hypothetical protein